MQSLDVVRRISDPEKRLRSAARLAREATEKADQARSERDLAALVLRRKHGWKPVEVYRLLGVSRGLFVRMTARAPAALPDIPNPEQVARKANVSVARYDEIAEQARVVRDEAARSLMASGAKSNADIARITGLTTARVAQVRLGKR